MYGLFYNPTYFMFVIPAMLLAFYAQWRVKSAYAKYTQKANWRQITGLQMARQVLGPIGLGDIQLEGIAGELTDHYDPRSKTLRLSAGVANQPSVASLAIVAHEIGHALQDRQNYVPLKMRGALVPALTVSSWVSPILFLTGFLFAARTPFGEPLIWLGILGFGLTAIFALVTLPVELDASRRGLQLLRSYNLVDGSELGEAKQVLDAAALTYVAAAAQAILTLLYYVTLVTGGRRRS